jgi:NAD(P)-dependent dehydrogenase (short-subunit alcohol dehydrogenase family)
VVVITGAGGGIGSEIVARFLDNRDVVIGTDRIPAALASLRERSNGNAERLHTAVADITSEVQCRELASSVAADLGRVDVLINCAGFFPMSAFEDITASDWNDVINVNLTGTFLMTQSVLGLMKDHGWGRIVNVTSSAALDGIAGRAQAYASNR